MLRIKHRFGWSLLSSGAFTSALGLSFVAQCVQPSRSSRKVSSVVGCPIVPRGFDGFRDLDDWEARGGWCLGQKNKGKMKKKQRKKELSAAGFDGSGTRTIGRRGGVVSRTKNKGKMKKTKEKGTINSWF
jgi:hypothetical protein